jgi:CrcB protein
MVAIGGALGAIARYQLAAIVQERVPIGFPWGTFVVNITGCFIMGIASTLLTDRIASANLRFLIPIGFIGAYTTFSTFELETFRAVSDGAWMIGALNVAGSVTLGYLALWSGIVVAQLI